MALPTISPYSLTTAFNNRASASEKAARRRKRSEDDVRNRRNRAARSEWHKGMASFHHGGKDPGPFVFPAK